MDYANKLSTLQERAIIQLAVNLCQENSFKELVLCLEKPTYGYFSRELFFVSDEKNYSIWVAKMRELPSNQMRRNLSYHIYMREQEDAGLEKECQRLTEKLPYVLRDRVRTWIKRIALEYQSYRCRLELLFRVSRYILMTFLSVGDWKETGRLDERKLALRLLEDERLTVFQKYQIACVYCLHIHIPKLWRKLSREEISSFTEDLKLLRKSIRSGVLMPWHNNYKTHVSVLWWSYQMKGKRKKELTKTELWTNAAEQATYYGNAAALTLCWERLNEQTRQQIVVDRALMCIRECVTKSKRDEYRQYLEDFEESSWPYTELDKNAFDLRSHHAELLLFFLSQMDEEQKLTLFKRAFSIGLDLSCLLDWPLQHELLPTIDRLDGIITNEIYRKCLFSLAKKCSENSTNENHIDDYRNLFWKLWQRTSEELKQYVFNSKRDAPHLLYFLLKRSPFLKEDEALFNRVFSDLSQEDRREMMRCCKQRELIILELLEQGRWTLLNWFLEECLPKEEIPSFKKEFIKSDFSCQWCLNNLGENRESLVQDVIDWCFEFDSEKSQFKCELVITADGAVKKTVHYFGDSGMFAELERIINFCVSSDGMKNEIKFDIALCACADLFRWNQLAPKWEQMDKILSWSSASEDKIRDLKKCFLHQEGIYSHYAIVFLKQNWEELERFYKWFDLSPEEIEDHKHIIFDDRYLIHILRAFDNYERDAYGLVAPLRWFLTDEEKVICFKERFLRILEGIDDLGVFEPEPKEWLDYVESELLRGLRKEKNENETSRGGTFVTNKGEKRSSVAIEDESNSRSK